MNNKNLEKKINERNEENNTNKINKRSKKRKKLKDHLQHVLSSVSTKLIRSVPKSLQITFNWILHA